MHSYLYCGNQLQILSMLFTKHVYLVNTFCVVVVCFFYNLYSLYTIEWIATKNLNILKIKGLYILHCALSLVIEHDFSAVTVSELLDILS